MLLYPTTVLLPQDLDTGDSPTFAGLTLSGLTEGGITFAGSGGVISQDKPNLFWKNDTNQLGIGTDAPTAGSLLDVRGNIDIGVNDAYLRLGAAQSVLMRYDSGNARLLIDLTPNAAGTGFNIATDGAANAISIDGATGYVGINQEPVLAQFNVTTTNYTVNRFIATFEDPGDNSGGAASVYNIDINSDSNSLSYYGMLFSLEHSGTGATNPINNIIGLALTSRLISQAAITKSINNIIAFDYQLYVNAGGSTTYNINGLSAIRIREFSASGTTNVTTVKLIDIRDFANTNSTNQYGIFVNEQTGGASNYEIWLTGGAGIFFRQGTETIDSPSAGHLSLKAATSIDPTALVDTTGITGDIFKFPNDTTAAGAYYGRVPINIAGVGTKYIHVYNA